MGKICAGVVALIALITTPVFAAPPVPSSPVHSWTGFYIGVDGGGGWNDPTGGRYCINPVGRLFGAGCGGNTQTNVVKPSGGLFGGTAGYNYQSGSIVYGIETDLQWSGIKGSGIMSITNPPGVPVYTATDNLNWFGTTRGRIGVLTAPNLLLYGTGGVVYGHESVTSLVFSPTSGFTYPAAAGATRVGWVGGLGLEYAFAGNLSAKVEGLYYDMGALTTGFTCPAAGTCAAGYTEGGNFKARGEIVRLGLNWHFGSPAARN